MTKDWTNEEYAFDVLHYINKMCKEPVTDKTLDDMAQEFKRVPKAILQWIWSAVQGLE